MKYRHLVALALLACCLADPAGGFALEPIRYQHPGLTVDLGVGLWAWPLPMDYDEDGDHDLVVVCPDYPYNGTYFFENKSGKTKMPVFEPAVRIGKTGPQKHRQSGWFVGACDE